MKIGIITYHRAKNLGAMLQSYALQKTLEKYKGKCEIIDYRNEKMEESYKVKKIRECKSLKEKIKNIIIIVLICLLVLITTLFIISKKDENKSKRPSMEC